MGERERPGPAGEEEDAGRDPVQTVNERQLPAELVPRHGEDAPGPVHRGPRGLLDGDVRLRPGRRREEREERDGHAPGRERNRRAMKITARFPAMFAAIPMTIGHCRNRMP